MSDRAWEILKELISINSPSGHEEKITTFIEDFLENLGYKIEKQEIGNIVVNPKADLWIMTHVDTIPPVANLQRRNSLVFGTGACDAKASVASILLFLEKVSKLKLGVALLVDEEEEGTGAKKIVKEYKKRLAIIMEPTSLKIADRHCGTLELEIDVKGEAAHASLPTQGINAIKQAMNMIKRIESLELPVDIAILRINGGGNIYAIPEECRIVIDFIIPPKLKVKDVEDAISRIIVQYGSYKILDRENPFFCSKEVCALIEKAMRESKLKIRYCRMPSWSDAVTLHKANWKVAVWGPGDLRVAHTKNEYVDIREVSKATNVLLKLNAIISKKTVKK